MLFDHVGFFVSNAEQSKGFYLSALKPVGIAVLAEGEGWVQIGRQGEGAFWFGQMGDPASPMHLAFAAQTRQQVRDFHAAAQAAGGRDNGAPGIREHYHKDYYAAFVFDPDGHNVEVASHLPATKAGI